MNSVFLPFSQAADRLISDPTVRGRVLAAAVAQALSRMAPLPSSPVDVPSNTYNLQVAPSIREMASLFNEHIVFDMRCVQDCAQTFWMVRYAAAHPAIGRLIYDPACSFFDAVLGVDQYVSDELCTFLEAHKNIILELSMIATDTILACNTKSFL